MTRLPPLEPWVLSATRDWSAANDGYDVEGFPVRLCTKVGPPSVRDVVHQFRIELSRDAVLSRAKQRLYLFNDANEPEGDKP